MAHIGPTSIYKVKAINSEGSEKEFTVIADSVVQATVQISNEFPTLNIVHVQQTHKPIEPPSSGATIYKSTDSYWWANMIR